MYILGIGPGIKIGHHDSSAALIKDGKIIAACEEERFLNEKKARARFPKNSIDFCLKTASIDIEDIDIVSSPLTTYNNYKKRIQLLFEFHYGYSPEVELHHHHLCHAASSYYLSGFEDSLVLTIDYSGDGASGLIAEGKGNDLKVIKYFDRNNSIGIFYSMITQFLGFNAHNDEYKVMGLASYGNPYYLKEMNQILTTKDFEPFLEKKFIRRFSTPEIYTTDFTTFQEMSFSHELMKLLGNPRITGEKITQKHMDIAASLQKQTENVVLEIINHYKNISKNFSFAGGIALNCKLNHEIIKRSFKNIFIQPAAGDAGISLGAALLSSVNNGCKIFDTENIVYLGLEYKNDEIKEYLDLCKLNYNYLLFPEKKAAELLAKNKIVGWFQGRSEWGPRALGNRSILANPMEKEMKDIVNKNIKFREDFRPFAPAVIKEDTSRYFYDCVDDPFMVTLARVTEHAQKSIPAVVHFDNTARLQTVDKGKNLKFWTLISEFGKLTGENVVLNTSLNLNGQPLCARLSEAIKAYFGSGMDYLIVGNFILGKE